MLTPAVLLRASSTAALSKVGDTAMVRMIVSWNPMPLGSDTRRRAGTEPVRNWKDARPMPSERPRLSRDAVLRTAQGIIDERGLDACTMRAVAAELGVEAMSLYWHVPNKEALLDGVIELMLAEMDGAYAADGDWTEALRAGARTFRHVVLRHRNALPLLASRPLSAYAAASRLTEQAIAALEGAGFDRPTAILAARTVSRYVMGFTFAERRPGDTPPASHSPSPTLDELMKAVAGDRQEDLFEFGLETLLRGLRTWREPA